MGANPRLSFSFSPPLICTSQSKSEIWRVRVLEFVLERSFFYSSFATPRDFAKIAVFLSRKGFRFETKSDGLKSTISQS
jgi:hypothetical protein